MWEIHLLRSTWRGLETELRLGLHGHEWGNLGYRQGLNLMDHRASPRPYRVRLSRPNEWGKIPVSKNSYGSVTNAIKRET